MSVANVDDVRRNVRAAIRRHWVLFLVPGVVMAILGLLAAASPFVATLVVETFAGWLFLTSGFVGLAALFTTRSLPGFVWTLLSAVLAILIGAFLVWRPFAGVVTLTLALAAFFAAHGIVQILTSLEAVSALVALAGHQRRRRFNPCRNHHRGLAGERGLGSRPAYRHQSFHVRCGAGDDRDCLPKRKRRVRDGSAGAPHDLTAAARCSGGRKFLEGRDGSVARISCRLLGLGDLRRHSCDRHGVPGTCRFHSRPSRPHCHCTQASGGRRDLSHGRSA
jgi:uncharacterized membrane protein HdeD (DUF308 family)